MLSAIRTEDRSQVILLREDGLARAEHLRQEARDGQLVCEVCNHSVVVRAGEERIWHFAHRSRIDCPKSRDSLEIVECRALLFGWLRVRFPDAVQVEKVLPGLPRPVDCWVERPGKPSLAWWLIAAAVKPDLRERMTAGCKRLGARLHPLFPARLLEQDPDHPGQVILSATLRELADDSAYAELYLDCAQSLHFLDPARRHLVTCRGLLAIHPPQGHLATLLDHPLEEVKLHPRTGEFVHPGEFEALRAHQEKAARERLIAEAREQRRRAREAEQKAERLRRSEEEARKRELEWRARTAERESERRAAQEAARFEVQPKPPTVGWDQVAEPPARPEPEPEPPILPDPAPEPLLTCKICGAQTLDWVVRYGSTGLCKCRNCGR